MRLTVTFSPKSVAEQADVLTMLAGLMPGYDGLKAAAEEAREKAAKAAGTSGSAPTINQAATAKVLEESVEEKPKEVQKKKAAAPKKKAEPKAEETDEKAAESKAEETDEEAAEKAAEALRVKMVKLARPITLAGGEGRSFVLSLCKEFGVKRMSDLATEQLPEAIERLEAYEG